MIVRDDRDRQEWDKLFDRVVVRCGWRLFSWALMDNHLHLLVRTTETNLSAGMHDWNSGYATWFNRRHRRSGSLFQGRFKAILVENESYGWMLSRYIHLNPVRAKIVRKAENYRWSSARAHCQGHTDGVLTKKAKWWQQFAQIPNWSAWLAAFAALSASCTG